MIQFFAALLTLLTVSTITFATERMPWFERDLIIPLRASYIYQTYPYVQASHGHFGHEAHDSFLPLSASIAYQDINAELELVFADTRRQHTTLDCIRLTGLYRIWNDIIGDPLSVVAGVTLTKAFSHSVKDPSSFHHGRIEAEFLVSAGRETSVEALWSTRWWGVLGLGIADHGSPWIRGELAWEKNWCDQQQLRLFVNTLWGLGRDNLHPCHHFHGYGPLNHQSIDLGARYSYVFESGLTLSAGFTRRIYARNFPVRANIVTLSLMYPIFSETITAYLWSLSSGKKCKKSDD